MKRICKREIQIDALTVCFEVENKYHLDQISQLDFGECYDLGEFRLYRTDGRYYNNIYSIIYNDGDNEKTFGQLKFNISQGDIQSNTHENGKQKVWISLNNEVLYSDDRYYLDFISSKLGLDFHNITTLDLCQDTPFNISKAVKRLIRDKKVVTILNTKKVKDRDEDRPEITYTNSGSLNKDKYMTINIKQKNAIHDKSKGVTVICYDKAAEIRNSSDKQYIMDFYGNPKKLFRTEVHLNNAEIKDYLSNRGFDINVYSIDNNIITAMFFHHLNNVIHFKNGKDNITWEQLLGRAA